MNIKNKKAFYEYTILDKIECGIVLKGSEIKSLRNNTADIKESFAVIKDNEIYLLNMYIPHYKQSNIFNHDERRNRKLLLHKSEIIKLKERIKINGITLVPLEVYLKNNYAKVLLGICKGKKLYDKREAIKKKDLERANHF